MLQLTGVEHWSRQTDSRGLEGAEAEGYYASTSGSIN